MRRIIICIAGAAALGIAACIGFALGKADAPKSIANNPAVAAVESTDEIEKFRTERQQLRQMQLSQLNEIIFSEDSEAEIVAMAQRRQLELMSWSEQETTLEGVLALRGFKDALVTVHTDSVNVMIRAETITQQESSVILELVMRETGISGGNVKIIPIK